MEIVLPTETGEFAGCKILKTPEVPPRVSVYDLIAAVKGVPLEHARMAFSRIKDDHPVTSTLCRSYKFPGRGNLTRPVTDARGAICIINLLPGKRAAEFRLKAADIVVRALGGDETLVQEIRANAAAQATLPEDHPMRLFGQTVEAESARKRSLDDDDELFEMRKRRALREERDALATSTINGYVSLLRNLEGLYAQLSDHAVPGALQNILVARTNATNRLLMATGQLVDETAAAGTLLALPSPAASRPAVPPAQSLVSRMTVLDMGRELRLPASKLTGTVLGRVGMFARDGWLRKGLGDLVQGVQGVWHRETYQETGLLDGRGLMRWEKQSERVEPEWSAELLEEHRIKYSSAFAGASELGLEKAHNCWTYPAVTGKEVLREAFVAAGVLQDDLYD